VKSEGISDFDEFQAAAAAAAAIITQIFTDSTQLLFARKEGNKIAGAQDLHFVS
jgi:hypothetical protein